MDSNALGCTVNYKVTNSQLQRHKQWHGLLEQACQAAPPFYAYSLASLCISACCVVVKAMPSLLCCGQSDAQLVVCSQSNASLLCVVDATPSSLCVVKAMPSLLCVVKAMPSLCCTHRFAALQSGFLSSLVWYASVVLPAIRGLLQLNSQE